jgi:hypothetical protein
MGSVSPRVARPTPLSWRVRCRKAATLHVADWGILLEAALTLLVVQLGLRTVGFPQLLDWTLTSPRMGRLSPSSEQVDHLAWLTGIPGRAVRASCLARSLTLGRLLNRRGAEARLRIGVRTGGEQLAAHAWVEWMDRVLDDHPHRVLGFAAFDRPIGAGSHG